MGRSLLRSGRGPDAAGGVCAPAPGRGAHRREGLRPVLGLAYAPVWAPLAPGAAARDPRVATRMPPRRVADWERFVGEAVRRYRDVVKEWQGWDRAARPR